MKLLAGGKKLDKTLARLIKEYDNFEFAVAWAGTGTETYAALCDNQSKIIRSVIGTHYYQTHPDVLDAFVGSDRVRFVPNTDELFHPKAYLFWNSGGWELIIGSANMTAGGLINNHELVLHVKSEDAPGEIKDTFQAQIKIYWDKANTITGEDTEGYRRFWQKYRSFRRKLASDYDSSNSSAQSKERKKTGKPPFQTEIMKMSWNAYLARLKGCDSFDVRKSIIGKARDAFKQHAHFNDMEDSLRKMLAGAPPKTDTDWRYFGNMRRARDFVKAIDEYVPNLSDALDHIPLSGPLNREQYLAYFEEFCRAFPDGGDGIAVLTRLLAMKRPDYFVCLDSKNMNKLCKDFGISTIYNKKYERYWDDVVCRITDSVWWNEPAPEDELGHEVWRARAAMLDTLFYKE